MENENKIPKEESYAPRKKKKSITIGIVSAAVVAIAGITTACFMLLNSNNNTPPGHTHSYSSWTVSKEASCTEPGEKSRSCSCGDIQTSVISSSNHSFGDWTVTIQATCTANGSQKRSCACGETETKSILAKGHSFSTWSTTLNATCTANGSQKRSCACGETETKSISAKGHSFSAWSTTLNATCTANGSQKRSCACGETETKALNATGHNWKSASCTDPKKCTVCNITEGNALGHSNNGSGICSRCGEKCTIDMKTVVGHPDECSTTSFFGFSFYKNSADGIKVCWGGENLSGKTINYYTVTIYFENSVGDPAYSEITGKSSKTIKYVGPVEPNKDLIIFGVVDYVPVCSKVIIGDITLEYADGTTDTGWYGWSTKRINSSLK